MVVQSDWFPYKRRKFGQTERHRGDVHAQRKGPEKRQEEGGHLQAKGKGLRGNLTMHRGKASGNLTSALSLDFQPPEH